MGSESEHLRLKIDELLGSLETEPDQRVRTWLDKYVGLLQRSANQARMAEERNDF